MGATPLLLVHQNHRQVGGVNKHANPVLKDHVHLILQLLVTAQALLMNRGQAWLRLFKKICLQLVTL